MMGVVGTSAVQGVVSDLKTVFSNMDIRDVIVENSYRCPDISYIFFHVVQLESSTKSSIKQ